MPLPNTILIGAQKAGTTSIYDWLMQHPDVCGHVDVKDFAFFAKDFHYNKGLKSLSNRFAKYYKNEKIILHGSVEYIFFDKALARIKKDCPNARFILILRDPVERLYSAFRYFKKMQLEVEDNLLSASIDKREERMHSDNYAIKNSLTYIDHGLYAKQLKSFYKYFSPEQIHICFFDDLKEHKEKLINRIYNFLEVSDSFEPNFVIKNMTGKVRNNLLQKVLFKRSKLRKFMVDNILDYIFPLQKRTELRWKLKEWNTIKKDVKSSKKEKMSDLERQTLLRYFIKDIEELEDMLNVDLTKWKK